MMGSYISFISSPEIKRNPIRIHIPLKRIMRMYFFSTQHSAFVHFCIAFWLLLLYDEHRKKMKTRTNSSLSI